MPKQEIIGMALLVVAGCDRHLGCEPVLRTDAGQLEILAPDTIVGACDSIRQTGPVLVGTRICPHLECGHDVEGCEIEEDVRIESELVHACFVPAVEGPARLEDDCVVFEGAGDVVWRFDAQPCAANDDGYLPASDQLTLPAVALDGVTMRLESPGDAFALRALDPGPRSSFPDDARIVPGGIVQVLADHEVPLSVIVDHPDHDNPVAWNPGTWSAELVIDDGEARWDAAGVLVVNVPADVEGEVALVQGETRSIVGRVRGVAESDLATLEVVAGYAPGGDEGPDHGPPIGARAIFRTADRAPVYGVPVEWEVLEGAFPVWRGTEDAWGPDYIALMDEDGQACHEPPDKDARSFEGLLVATHGDFEAEVELTWTEDPEHTSFGSEIGEFLLGNDHKNSDLCEGPGFPPVGCSCATGSTSPWAAVAPFILFFALSRRRRRRSR